MSCSTRRHDLGSGLVHSIGMFLHISSRFCSTESRHDIQVKIKHSIKKSETRTCYQLHRLGLLASGQEYNVSLRCLDMAILEHKDLVYAIFLKCAELDKQSNGSKEVLFDDQVLLAPNLDGVRVSESHIDTSVELLTPSSNCNKSLRALSVIS